MKKAKLITWLPLCGLVLAGMVGPAFGQEGGKNSIAYVGTTASTKADCSYISYLFRGLSETLVGYVWYADGSGMSKATGPMDLTTGKFHLTVTPLDGNGPSGEVDGVRDPDTRAVTADLVGPGCSNLKLAPMSPVLTYTLRGHT